MNEKDITNKIFKYTKQIDGCFCWKEHGGMYGTAGLPDIICCIDGRFLAFEVKTPGSKPTKLQDAMLKRIRAAGGISHVVYGVDDVKAIISKIRE